MTCNIARLFFASVLLVAGQAVFTRGPILIHASAEEQPRRTTLRILEKPKGTFIRDVRGFLIQRHVEVEVRNMGSADAEGIRVTATLPNGSRVELDGPTTLKQNRTAVYTRDLYAVVDREEGIEGSATCDNCR